jgi:SAM-dependent methyltransferase
MSAATCGTGLAAASLAAAVMVSQFMAPHGVAAQPTGRDVVPTPQVLVEKMLDLAEVTANDIVVDLGSGDGRTVIAAARRGAIARGIEYNAAMVELSRANAAREGLSDKAAFEHADIFASDFSDASVVTLFLLPELYERLRPILLGMKPGTRVVSNSFGMGAWRPDRVATVPEECDFYFCKALLWIVPASVEGNWTMENSELSLRQNFQAFAGTLSNRDATIPVSGRLTGGDITFTAGDIVYMGKVHGDIIEGKTGSGGTWQARRGARAAIQTRP